MLRDTVILKIPRRQVSSRCVPYRPAWNWSVDIMETHLQERTAPKTMTVPDAGRIYFGLGRNASYDAAKRGDIPTIKIGRLLRVPVTAMERRLEQAA